MKNFIKWTISGLISLFSVTATAGLITDTVYVNTFLSTSGWDAVTGNFDSVSFTHDINDDGFVLGSATSGTLYIDIKDDKDKWYQLKSESVLYQVEEFDGDTGEIQFLFASDLDTDIEVEALAAINADGYLDISVVSLLGDFWVKSSVLEVVTAAVPEPATLGLLAFGIAGLAAARRRKPA